MVKTVLFLDCGVWKLLNKPSIINSKTLLSIHCFNENISFSSRVDSQEGVTHKMSTLLLFVTYEN
jgi:hypothetical protein